MDRWKNARRSGSRSGSRASASCSGSGASSRGASSIFNRSRRRACSSRGATFTPTSLICTSSSATRSEASSGAARCRTHADLTLLAKDDLVLGAYGQEGAGDAANNAVILALDARTGVERWRAPLGDASTFA